MKLELQVIAQYPLVSGTYMGQEWKNQSFVVATTETHQDSNVRDRLVIKVKGQKLDEFLAEGIQNGGAYVLDLYMDAEEKIGKDGSPYPVNKSITCVGWEKA